MSASSQAADRIIDINAMYVSGRQTLLELSDICAKTQKEFPPEQLSEIKAGLLFDNSKFSQYVQIGKCRYLYDPKVMVLLPPSRTTLYNLALLGKAALTALIQEGVLRVKMTRDDLDRWIESRSPAQPKAEVAGESIGPTSEAAVSDEKPPKPKTRSGAAVMMPYCDRAIQFLPRASVDEITKIDTTLKSWGTKSLVSIRIPTEPEFQAAMAVWLRGFHRDFVAKTRRRAKIAAQERLWDKKPKTETRKTWRGRNDGIKSNADISPDATIRDCYESLKYFGMPDEAERVAMETMTNLPPPPRSPDGSEFDLSKYIEVPWVAGDKAATLADHFDSIVGPTAWENIQENYDRKYDERSRKREMKSPKTPPEGAATLDPFIDEPSAPSKSTVMVAPESESSSFSVKAEVKGQDNSAARRGPKVRQPKKHSVATSVKAKVA